MTKTKKNIEDLWEKNIREAKGYVQNYQKTRWIICDLCNEVCDTSHGGRKTNSIYSITRFANEIEIDRKTLYEWLRVKKLVVDKLSKTTREKIHTFKYSDIEGIVDKVNENDSQKHVQMLFERQLEIDPATKTFKKYIKHMKSILFNASKPLRTKEIPQIEVEEMVKLCNTIAGLLSKEISLREKYGSTARADEIRLNVKKELKQRISSESQNANN